MSTSGEHVVEKGRYLTVYAISTSYALAAWGGF